MSKLKPSLFFLFAVLAIQLPAQNGANNTDSLAVDDFEDGDTVSAFGWTWLPFTTNDEPTISVKLYTDANQNNQLVATGATPTGNNPYGGLVLQATSTGGSQIMNFSKYKA